MISQCGLRNYLSGAEQSCVLSLFMWNILMDFVLRNTAKAIGEQRIKWGNNPFLDLDYANDLGILDENVSKMDEILEVLWVLCARIGFQITDKEI